MRITPPFCPKSSSVCTGVPCFEKSGAPHAARWGPPQYPQLRQSQLRLVITTVEITSKLRRNFVVNRGIPFYRLREVRGRPAAQGDCGRGRGKGGQKKESGPNRHPEQPLDAPRWTPLEIRPFPLVFPMYCASGRLFSDICLAESNRPKCSLGAVSWRGAATAAAFVQTR